MIKEVMSWLAVGAAGLSALLTVAGSAHATFLTCPEWDARGRNERETYIAGVFNGVSDTPTGMHYYRWARVPPQASAPNIRHRVRYTELEPDRVKDFWR